MRLVKVGIANVKTTVGAVRSNVDRALRIAHEMHAADVTLGVFQEQLVGGYPPEDLVQWQGFIGTVLSRSGSRGRRRSAAAARSGAGRGSSPRGSPRRTGRTA